jgi:N-acetylglutamate synthase-like GNAT family acetyltransferase
MSPDLHSVEIRRAGPDDAEAIASVLLQAFAEYKPLYTIAGFTATTPTPLEILTRMEEGPHWVALHEGMVIGTVSAVVRGESVYIRGMAVLPQARGLRVGELLLREAESFASESNLRHLFLRTTPFLDRAIRLYRKFGFERTADGPHDLFETPIFTMEKWTTADKL